MQYLEIKEEAAVLVETGMGEGVARIESGASEVAVEVGEVGEVSEVGEGVGGVGEGIGEVGEWGHR